MVSKVFRAVIGLGVIAAFLAGCADVPSTGPTPPDPKSQMRFVNADPGLPNVTVSVDNAASGTIAFQAATGYGEYPAGSRKVALNPGTAADTARIAFTTDRRSTIFILPQVSGAREYFKVNERFVYNAPGVANRALMRAINLAVFPDADGNDVGVDAVFTGPDTLVAEEGLYKDSTPYFDLLPGSYAITLYLAGTDSVVASGSVSMAANKRYTTVVMGTATAPALVSLTDD
jgi:hypothetical protein